MNTLPDAGYLLDQLMSSTLDAIYFKDLKSRFIVINQACADKHGWSSPAEGIGKTDHDVFSREHADKAYAEEQRIITTGAPLFGIEERETWPDGRITWCSSTKMPLRDEDGSVAGIFGITRDITDRKEAELRKARYVEMINTIKEELENDARLAGQLQRSFFPASYPVFPEGVDPADSCVEFLYHFNKCNLVSGDYCSINRVSASKVGILLCDVLGTGARAALAAALIRGIMQEIDPVSDDPSAYLGRMNELLYPLLHPDPDHALLEVTACYMVLDVTTGLARVASAAHPLPLHFRKGRPVKWLFENLVLRGPALAAGPNSRFHTIECRTIADDMVVLFTDGLVSARNAGGELFNEHRLLRSAQELAGRTLGDIYRGLEGEVVEFSKDGHFTDDTCLVGFHLRNLLETI